MRTMSSSVSRTDAGSAASRAKNVSRFSVTMLSLSNELIDAITDRRTFINPLTEGASMSWHEKDHFTSVRPFSDRCASWFAWTTPNLITLASLVLVAPMCWAFTTGRIVLGAAFFTLSAVGDFLDGALARYQHDRMTADEQAAER